MAKRGVFELFNASKRGLSPLIATVLLIAFAVAMGAMIMNWSTDVGESGPDCSGIRLVMNPIICYNQNFIKLNLKNEGGIVDELTVRVSDDNTENDLSLKNSRLRRGDSFQKDIPFVKTGTTYVGVIPSLVKDGKTISCGDPIIEIFDLQDCPETG